MRDWVVGAALIVSEAGLLLVRNRRRNGAHDWSPPAGVIEEGEAVLDGLRREVEEETGLQVTQWEGPIYEVRCEAPDLGWRLRAEAHLAVAYRGELHVDDPDGIVVEARWVREAECAPMLEQCHPWVREPLAAWLAEPWGAAGRSTFRFHVAGADPATLVVTRGP